MKKNEKRQIVYTVQNKLLIYNRREKALTQKKGSNIWRKKWKKEKIKGRKTALPSIVIGYNIITTSFTMVHLQRAGC